MSSLLRLSTVCDSGREKENERESLRAALDGWKRVCDVGRKLDRRALSILFCELGGKNFDFCLGVLIHPLSDDGWMDGLFARLTKREMVKEMDGWMDGGPRSTIKGIGNGIDENALSFSLFHPRRRQGKRMLGQI